MAAGADANAKQSHWQSPMDDKSIWSRQAPISRLNNSSIQASTQGRDWRPASSELAAAAAADRSELKPKSIPNSKLNNVKDDYGRMNNPIGLRKGVVGEQDFPSTTRGGDLATSDNATLPVELIESLLADEALSPPASSAGPTQTDSAGGTVCELFHDKTYVVYSALGSFYIPALIMVFFYSRIYLVASRAQKAMQRGYMTTKWPPMATSSCPARRTNSGSGSGSPLRRENSLCNRNAAESRSRSLARGVVAKWNQHKLANSNATERNNAPTHNKQPNGHLMQTGADCNSSISGYLASASSSVPGANECVPCEPERVTLRIHRRVDPPPPTPGDDSVLSTDQQLVGGHSFDRLSQSSGASRGSRRSGAHNAPVDKSSSAPLNGESFKSLLSRGVKSLGRQATATISSPTTQADHSQSQLIQLTAIERSQATRAAAGSGQRRTRFSLDKTVPVTASAQTNETKRASLPSKIGPRQGRSHPEAARPLNVSRSSPISQMALGSSRERAARSESIQTETIDEERDETVSDQPTRVGDQNASSASDRQQEPSERRDYSLKRRKSSITKQQVRAKATGARHCLCLKRRQLECSHQLAHHQANRKQQQHRAHHHHHGHRRHHHHHHHRRRNQHKASERFSHQCQSELKEVPERTGDDVADRTGNHSIRSDSSIELMDEIESVKSIQIIIQNEDNDNDQVQPVSSNSQPTIPMDDAQVDQLLEVSKCERSRSVDVTPGLRMTVAPPPIVLVNWDPASGHAESLLSPDTAAIQSPNQLRNKSHTGSGLSLVTNIPSQVRKQSIMLLSSITSRSSQTLRRLSMVAAHPVDVLMRSKSSSETRARPGPDSSDLSRSSSQPQSQDGADDGNNRDQEATGTQRPGASDCSAPGASKIKSGRKLLRQRGKWRGAGRRKRRQRSNSLVVCHDQQQTMSRKKTLDDYLMAVAGIDSSSGSSRSDSDNEEEDEDDDDDDDDEDESDLERGRSLASMLRREHLLIPAITIASPPGDQQQSGSAREQQARNKPQATSNSVAFDFAPGGLSSSARTSIVSFRSCGGTVCPPTSCSKEEQEQAISREQLADIKKKAYSTNDIKVKRAKRLPPSSGLQRQGALYESATSQRVNSQAHIDLLLEDERQKPAPSIQLDVDTERDRPSSTPAEGFSHSPDLFRLEQARAIKRSPITGGVARANEPARNQRQLMEQTPLIRGQPQTRRRAAKRTSRWHAKRLRAETKAAKTVAIIVGGFIFCWLPFFTAYLARALICASPACIPQTWLSLFIWLGYLNSAINPVIYGLFSADFRRAFKNIVCQCRWHRHAQRPNRGAGLALGLTTRLAASNDRGGVQNTATVPGLDDSIIK